MNVHVTTNNSKTGIYSFNLLAGDGAHAYDGRLPAAFRCDDAPGADYTLQLAAKWHAMAAEFGPIMCGTCGKNHDCPGCYAKDSTRYPATAINYAENTILARIDPAGTVAAVENELYNGATAPRYFRIHDSGDFFSYDYFAAWADMARRHPETRFYCYTKERGIVLKYGVDNLPGNFVVNCSPWPGVSDPIADLPQFIYDAGTDPEIAKLPHCPAVDKDGKRTGVQCINCRHCANAKRGDRWAVYAH